MSNVRKSVWLQCLLVSVLWCCIGVRAAEPLAVLSIVEGEVALLRLDGRFTAGEGNRLAAADIVETGPQARLARIEFSDGVIADLGPATRVLLAPALTGAGAPPPPRVYLLQGWLKLTVPDATPPLAPGLLTPAIEIDETAGQLVVASTSDGFMAFSEAGAATLQDRAAKPPAGTSRLKAGQFFAQPAGGKSEVKPRPTPAFIQALPRPFLDRLPARAAQFKARDIAPKRQGDLRYDDAAAWLGAEPALRRLFLAQWRALARRADFRAGLAANMRAHPEWDRVVFPEKYRPRPPASSTR